jgi:hypothetical protein
VLLLNDYSYLEKRPTGSLVFPLVQFVMVPSLFSETSHWPLLEEVTVLLKRLLVSFIAFWVVAKLISDLTKYASHVYVLVRKGELRASKIMAKRLVQHPKVTVMWNTVATECKGDGDLLQSLALQNTKTGETSELQVNGLFYAIGMSPSLDIIEADNQDTSPLLPLSNPRSS